MIKFVVYFEWWFDLLHNPDPNPYQNSCRDFMASPGLIVCVGAAGWLGGRGCAYQCARRGGLVWGGSSSGSGHIRSCFLPTLYTSLRASDSQFLSNSNYCCWWTAAPIAWYLWYYLHYVKNLYSLHLAFTRRGENDSFSPSINIYYTAVHLT